jgi:hypothetical protein
MSFLSATKVFSKQRTIFGTLLCRRTFSKNVKTRPKEEQEKAEEEVSVGQRIAKTVEEGFNRKAFLFFSSRFVLGNRSWCSGGEIGWNGY